MSASTASAGSPASKPRATTERFPTGERLVLAGVLVATFGVAVAMLPGGYSPFGPAKALVLLSGCALVALGFALAPELAARALTRALAQRGAWPAFGLVGLACLATATSIDPSQSLVGHYPEYQGLLLLLTSALVALGTYALAEHDATWRVIGRAAVIALLAVAAYALVQIVGADPVIYERILVVRRVRSTLGNASNLGVFLCFALPLALARARSDRAAWRVAAWAAVALGCVTLAWSLSRGAWAGAFAGAAAWLVVEGRSWDRSTRVRIATIALGFAVAAVALAVILVPNAGGRLGRVLDTSSGTAGWRLEVWRGASQLVAERPLLGFGPGSFRYAMPPRQTAAMHAGETGVQSLDDPHNLFASAGVSAGVLAIAALAWLLGEALLCAWTIRRDDSWGFGGPALAAALVAGTVALQFHFATLDTAPLLAALIALALGRRAPAADETTSRAVRAARVLSGALAGILALAVVAAGGLVFADRRIARGFALVDAGQPWATSRAAFVSAARFAPWEPAAQWALGRGGTQAMSVRGDLSAFDDAARSLESARARLPLDPLVVAQNADAYLVAGVATHDPARLRLAIPLLDRAIDLDPQNGYRWAAKGTALAGLGDTQGALSAFERAVLYSPNDVQAWASLGKLYARIGLSTKASEAQRRADELATAQP